MDLEKIVAVVVAGAGAAATGVTIGVWLIKEKFSKVFQVTDRMPPVEWFGEVATTLKSLPTGSWFERIEEKVDKLDPERMSSHFERVHTLSNQVMELKMAVSRLEKEDVDHESRIRELERARHA